jgi:DNA modification methylase
VEHWLTAFSKPSDTVCDPLGGSFTTAVACIRSGRRFVGCDCEEQNVAAGQQRLAEFRAVSSLTKRHR